MDGRGEREELRGLVGWRRWGSPAAKDTHTHTGPDTRERGGGNKLD